MHHSHRHHIAFAIQSKIRHISSIAHKHGPTLDQTLIYGRGAKFGISHLANPYAVISEPNAENDTFVSEAETYNLSVASIVIPRVRAVVSDAPTVTSFAK